MKVTFDLDKKLIFAPFGMRLNEVYSRIMDRFEDLDLMDNVVPMSWRRIDSTTVEYLLHDGWRIDGAAWPPENMFMAIPSIRP